MKTDVNKENDEMMRRGLSELHEINKQTEARREMLRQPGVKEDLMKFIFGESDFNPLREKSSKKSEKN